MRRFIVSTQIALGMYDEALSTYNEIERHLGADTINNNYTAILRSRAIVARAKGRITEAYDYQTRYAALSKVVSDSLHRSEAHDYAARYHAQELQLEIQEKKAEAERLHIVSLAVALIALLAIAFAIYFFRQKRIVSEKNHAVGSNSCIPLIEGAPCTLDVTTENAMLSFNIKGSVQPYDVDIATPKLIKEKEL